MFLHRSFLTNCFCFHKGPGTIRALEVNNNYSHNSTDIIVTWQPSTDNNCRETGYLISVELVEIDQCKTPQQSEQSHYMRYIGADELRVATFEDLLSHSTYNVTVTANNSAGFGDEVFIHHVSKISGELYLLFLTSVFLESCALFASIRRYE